LFLEKKENFRNMDPMFRQYLDYHGHLLEQDQGDGQGHAEQGAEHLRKREKLSKFSFNFFFL